MGLLRRGTEFLTKRWLPYTRLPVTQPTSTTEDPASEGDATGVDVQRPARWHLALLALISYVPLLYTRPGSIAADTKVYLYLDPERLTRLRVHGGPIRKPLRAGILVVQ